MIHCLDPEVVITINQEHVNATGEPFALLNRFGLESALARPLATYDGRDLIPTVAGRAGALIDSMAQAHPFQQGNKRTAWDAAITYLASCGWSVEASTLDATEFVLGVVEHKYDHIEASLWFSDRLLRI